MSSKIKNIHSFEISGADMAQIENIDLFELADIIDNMPQIPILPVMDQVLFPGVIIPVAAQRQSSLRLLSDVREREDYIAVFTQRNDKEEPKKEDLYLHGVVAKVLKVISPAKDFTIAIIVGIERCILHKIDTSTPYMKGQAIVCPEDRSALGKAAFTKKLKYLRKHYDEVMKGHNKEDIISPMLKEVNNDLTYVNYICTHLDIPTEQKMDMLSTGNYLERMDMLVQFIDEIKNLDEVAKEIEMKTQHDMSMQQREYYLHRQLDIIQDELNMVGEDGISANPDVAELQEKAREKKWSKEVAEMFQKELKKFARIPQMSGEYGVQQNYLETMVELPWGEMVESKMSLEKAQQTLEEDHYGIEKVKERVIEYLAVMQRQMESGKGTKAQVLCLVGPPGTGKTSICRSIAKALGRPYQRIALGGLHDEAEIRGHRRTYVGAMPGRIIQEIAKAGVVNPVFVLDEIDKVQTVSNNGDPSSALLELLDPEQNCHFHDNFINVDFDLSQVLFIATANSISEIQPALLDRMEVIDFSGFVEDEKIAIAKRHIIRRVLNDHAVDGRTCRFSDKALKTIIDEYTRESGVRQLEKQITKIVRHRVVQMAKGSEVKGTVSETEVREVLGLPIHKSESMLKESREGVVTGLAWTPVGGEILFIEASTSIGRGTLTLTGNLGEVMKESATLAYEYIKSNSGKFGISTSTIENNNIHIHVPEGATPKDGPSAGITMFTAMVSALSHKRVNPKVAMTGEITLRGSVTPIGGVKEKILAAKRAGISDIVLCEDNRRDIEDIEKQYLEGLQFHYIKEMSEVLPIAMQ